MTMGGDVLIAEAAVLFGIFLLSVLSHGLFAGFETGFVSCNPIRIRYLAENEGSKAAQRLLYFMDRPHQMLTLLLLGDNVSTVIGTIAITRGLEQVLGMEAVALVAVLAILIATPMFLVFSEIVPKSVFRTHPNRLTMLLITPMRLLFFALYPVVIPVSLLTSWVLRIVGDSEKHLSPLMSSRDDVRTLVDETADHGAIEPEEQQMIHSVIGLQEKHAKEIMQPRINVKALPNTASRDELLALSADTGRTRIPIFEENIDSIIGIVNTYDILADPDPDKPAWDRFIKPVQRVPDSMKLDDLLEHLKAEKQHIAVVIDEYGGTDGIVTIEDILEEIFGEIEDEHDVEEKPIRKIGNGTFIIDARMPLVDAVAEMAIELVDDSVETIGGWVMRHAGRIPEPGEVITHNGYKMTILEGDRNVVSRIRLDIEPKQEASSAHSTTS